MCPPPPHTKPATPTREGSGAPPFSSWASPKPVVLSLAAFAAVGFVFNARTVFEKVAAKL